MENYKIKMNFRPSTRSTAVVILTLSLISMTLVQQDAFAQSDGMSISVMADNGADTVMINGLTTSDATDVTFKITSPTGKVVAIGQSTPDQNGEFAEEFKIGSSWTEDGFYQILVTQRATLHTLDTIIEIRDGVALRTMENESNIAPLFEQSSTTATIPRGIQISAEASVGSTEIMIVGTTDRVSQDVALTVTAPNGNVVTADQATPTLDGEFSAMLITGGPLWKQDGMYTVTAQQFNDEKYTATVMVDIQDGVVVPEFGTIAVMILAVAIVSIIAVSARSRLSIIPRY